VEVVGEKPIIHVNDLVQMEVMIIVHGEKIVMLI
jgi:hypothetical protein